MPTNNATVFNAAGPSIGSSDIRIASGQYIGIDSPLTAFGEVSTAQSRPFIQATAAYNLIPANFREYTSGTGTTGAASHMFQVTTGTGGSGSYGTIQSFRAINYKAGEGGMARFTGLFTTGVANSWQGVGLFTIADELSFGYNGTDFGVWHRSHGASEIRTVQVTGAAGGSENLTLTLNGTGYTIPLTTGTVQHNAHEIEEWLNANQSVWHAQQVDDTVTVTALSDSAKSGAYTFSSATATGSLAQVTAGVTKTSTHIAQGSWNGTTPSGFDPTKGNVYQIKFQYLGFGNIEYYIEDPDTGKFVKCHTIKYAGANTTTSLSNPSMHIGLYAVSLGSTTDLTVKSGSLAGFVEGFEGRTRNPRAEEFTQTIGTSAYTNILTIRNTRHYGGLINQQEITPDYLILSNEGAKNCEIEVRGNATPGGDTDFQDIGTNLLADIDTSAVTMTGGRFLLGASIGGGDSVTIDLTKLRIRIPPTLKLSVSGKLTSGASAPVTATLIWYEDL